MKNERISANEIFEAANAIAVKGKIPTLAAVRLKLGNRGSQTTLHKYLNQWKMDRFKEISIEEGPDEPKALIEEKRILKQELNQQKAQNEQYARELIHAEKALLKLGEENQRLKIEHTKLENDLKEVNSLKVFFENLYLEIKAERENFFEKIMAEKNRQIDSLQEELKIINQQAITELRNVGYERDDAIMQERVKIINLQEKIIKLGEENKALIEELKQEKQAKILQKQTQVQGIAKFGEGNTL